MKRKPKVVEAWMVLSRHGDWIAMSMAERIAKTYVVNPGDHLVRLVPADPHAKLKTDVLRAAVGHYVAHGSRTHSNTCDVCAAVSKLQKVKP